MTATPDLFWMVFSTDGLLTKEHPTRAAADAEAHRMAKVKADRVVHVLELVGTFATEPRRVVEVMRRESVLSPDPAAPVRDDEEDGA